MLKKKFTLKTAEATFPKKKEKEKKMPLMRDTLVSNVVWGLLGRETPRLEIGNMNSGSRISTEKA